MKARPILANLCTRFAVYCPECFRVEHADTMLDAEAVRRTHVCPDSAADGLGAELREVCRA